MPEMIALKPHRYANVQRKVGDRYQAKPGPEIGVVRALKWAEEAPVVAARTPPATVPARTYARRDMVVAEPAVAPEDKPKRQYKRRDMTAEE